jgi:hypothetical protein
MPGLARQLGARLDLGDRIIPAPSDETLERANRMIAGQGPANAVLLADPPAGFNRGPGFIEPVKRYENVTAGNVDRIPVSQPARALVSQQHGIVGDLQRLPEVAAVSETTASEAMAILVAA